MFGQLTELRRAQGWISIEELYKLHRVRLRPERLVRLAAERIGAPASDPRTGNAVPKVPSRPIVRSTRATPRA